MELRQLKYFCAVAELKSLTAAADRLNVTQPAIGMQLRKLEDSVGLKLVLRHSRGIRLTRAGELMLDHANEILVRVDNARRSLKRLRGGEEAEIRIGVTPSLSAVFAPRLMEICHDKYPQIELRFAQGFPDELLRDFEAGGMEFCFVNIDVDTEESESVPLYYEAIKLIGAAEHIHALPDPMSLEELAALPLVLDGRDNALQSLLSAALSPVGLKLNDVIEVRAITLRRSYATKQRRFCLAPEALFHQEIASGLCSSRALPVSGLDRCIQLVGPRVERMNTAESRIRAIVIEIVEEMVAESGYDWTFP